MHRPDSHHSSLAGTSSGLRDPVIPAQACKPPQHLWLAATSLDVKALQFGLQQRPAVNLQRGNGKCSPFSKQPAISAPSA